MTIQKRLDLLEQTTRARRPGAELVFIETYPDGSHTRSGLPLSLEDYELLMLGEPLTDDEGLRVVEVMLDEDPED